MTAQKIRSNAENLLQETLVRNDIRNQEQTATSGFSEKAQQQNNGFPNRSSFYSQEPSAKRVRYDKSSIQGNVIDREEVSSTSSMCRVFRQCVITDKLRESISVLIKRSYIFIAFHLFCRTSKVLVYRLHCPEMKNCAKQSSNGC